MELSKTPIQEVIDKALAYGKACSLDNKQIEYLIKAIAQSRFGDDANKKLKKFNIVVVEDDQEGIKEANKFLSDICQEFLDAAEECECSPSINSEI